VLPCRGAHLTPEVQRGQGVGQRAADQELHRQVVDAARPSLTVGAVAGHPASGQLLARDLSHRVHDVRQGGCRRFGAYCSQEMLVDGGCGGRVVEGVGGGVHA